MLNQRNERKNGQAAVLGCLTELSPRREPLLQYEEPHKEILPWKLSTLREWT